MIVSRERPAPKLQVGERVKHDKYGEGVVQKLSYSSNGKHVHADIEFDSPAQASPNSPATRYRKIMESYLIGLGVPEPLQVEGVDPAGMISITGSEIDSLLTGDIDESYSPTEDDKKEVSDSDEELDFS